MSRDWAWKEVLRDIGLWRRCLIVGLCAGFLQALVNQGDHWWQGAVDASVVVKTLLCPVVASGVALASAIWTGASWRADRRARELSNDCIAVE